GPGARQTFGAQSAHVFQAQGRLYALLDHWQPDDLRHSGYTALPIQEGGQFLTLPWQENWEGLL
ncbi:glycosyl hydrolase family 43, partial [bacterium]|nr:glycosyl hydrolase family 43 [bacterium]